MPWSIWPTVALIGASLLAAAPAASADLFNNTNTMQVTPCASPFIGCQPRFKLPRPGVPSSATSFQIDEIVTYHAQSAVTSGQTISLRASNGAVIGTYQVKVQPASPGFEDWTATVGTAVPADTYTIIDSQADTWEQNASSGDDTAPGGKGFAIVRGSAAKSGVAADDASDTDCEASCGERPTGSNAPIFECSAHGPHAQCLQVAPTAELPGLNVMCTDGRHTTTCNCRTGCTTR
jgi:hypothetical protein